MRIILFLALPLLSVSLSFKTAEHLADFDDIAYGFNNLTAAIALYSGLYWSHFTLYLPYSASGNHQGVAASSLPFHALSTSDRHNIISFPATHAAFELTGNSFFDLKTFNWACLRVDASTHLAVQPETFINCSLTVRCYPPRGTATLAGSGAADSETLASPSATAVYFFIVSSSMRIWGVQMSKVCLDERFRGCQSVTWDVQALVDGGAREVALALDNVKYRTYRITAWNWKGLGELIHENGPYGIA